MAEQRIVVYTAIFSGYDNLTEVQSCDTFEYFCITDDIKWAKAGFECGWRIIYYPVCFTDPKLMNGFVKANSHLFFGNSVITIWLDANLVNLKIPSDVVSTVLAGRSCAVVVHGDRTSIREEIDVVVQLGLENETLTSGYYKDISRQGFKDDVGLAATMFLVRDHSDPKVRAGNCFWWSVISSGLRRDQVSFNFAMWKAEVQLNYLQVDWKKSNEYFLRVKHLNPVGRLCNKSRFPVVLNMKKMPADYPQSICFFSESVGEFEIETYRELNKIVSLYTGGVVEGNYCYFHKSVVSEFTPPDVRRSWKREYLRRSVYGCKSVLEIGFNAGHSANLILQTSSAIRLTSVDIGCHKYTVHCGKLLTRVFSERFTLILADSKEALKEIVASEFDFVHIDGGHDRETFSNDLSWFLQYALPGTRLMVDDCYASHIRQLLDAACHKEAIRPLCCGFPSSGENMLFEKM